MRNTFPAFPSLILGLTRFNLQEKWIFFRLPLLFCVLVWTLAVNVQAQTLSVSPSTSSDGNYTLTYSFPTMASNITVSYWLSEKAGNSNWYRMATLSNNSTSYSISGRGAGTYSYRIGRRVCPPYTSSCSETEELFGPVSVTVVQSAPSAPGSITVTPDHAAQRFTVSWPTATGPVARYELERNGTAIYNGTVLSHTITDVAAGVSYTFRVRSCSSSNQCSDWRTASPASLMVPAPSVPGSISVVPDNVGLTFAVSWSVSTGQVARYELERDNSNIYTGTALSRTVTGVAVGVSYTFRVRACSSSNLCSAWRTANPSSLIGSAPSIPGSITVTPNHSPQTFSVSWAASTGQVARYELERDSANIYSGTALSQTISGLAAGVNYVFRVRACSSTSLCSAWRTAEPQSLMEQFNVPATSTTGQYTITYISLAGTMTLQEQEGQGAWVNIHTSSSGVQSVPRVKHNGTYNYRLYYCPTQTTTCNFFGSVKTTVVSGLVPATPDSITINSVADNNSLVISWPSVPGASTYRLQQGSTVLQNTGSLHYTFPNATPGVSYTFSVWACAGSACSANPRTGSGMILPTPAQITAVPDIANRSMTVTWSTVSGASTYELQQNGTQIFKGNALTRTQTNLSHGSTYTYRIRACDAADKCSVWRTAEPVLLPHPAPSIPGSITVTANHGAQSFAVSWAAATGQVARYELERNSSNIYSGTALSQSVTGMSYGVSYTFRVRACNNTNLCSGWRTADPQTLVHQFDVPATSTTGQYTITYVSLAGTMTLQEQEGQGAWVNIHTSGSGVQSVPRVKHNGTFNYRLHYCPTQSTTCNFFGDVKTTVVSGVAPAVPASITINPVAENNSLVVSWPSVPGASTYRLQHGSTVLQNTGSLNYTFPNATPGVSYTFSVWACAGSVCSANPRTGSGMILPTPAQITVVPDITNRSMAVTWHTVSGASTYELQQNGTQIFKGNALTRTQTNLSHGSTYTYRVRACDAADKCSVWKTAEPVLLPHPAPSMPGSITVAPNHGAQRFAVSWIASTGQVARYELERNNSNIYSGTELSRTVTDVVVGVSYTFRVRACNSSNLCSDWRTAGPQTLVHQFDVPATSTTGQYTITYLSLAGTMTLQEQEGQGAWVNIHTSSSGVQAVPRVKHNGIYNYRLYYCPTQTTTCHFFGEIKTTHVTIPVSSSSAVSSFSSSAVSSSASSLNSSIVSSSTGSSGSSVVSSSASSSGDIGGTGHVNSQPPAGPGSTVPVGSTAGSFRVDESGAATYSIPLALPQGTTGVTPQINLFYSSQGGNGVLGKGWSLSGLSAISRCRQTLMQDEQAYPITWSSDDRFCLDGQRLMLVSGNYGSAYSTYKTEIDRFVTVTAMGGVAGHPEYFIVEAKDGSTSYYGNTLNSRAGESGQVLTWAINRFRDNVGNVIEFVYEGDAASGQRIKTVHYAFSSTSDGNTSPRTDSNAQVNFEYESRPDPSSGYVAGQLFGQDQRLKQINVVNKVNNASAEVRRYHLNYMATSTAEARYQNTISRLESIQECVGTACYPAKSFIWGGGSFVSLNQASYVANSAYMGVGEYITNHLFADMTGNGKQDLIHQKIRPVPTQAHPRRADVDIRVRHADDGGSSSTVSLGTVNDYAAIRVDTLDYNADGRQDLAVYDGSAWRIYLSIPQHDGTWRLQAGNHVANAIQSDKNISFVDVNSDGLADVVSSYGYRLSKRNHQEPAASNKAYMFAPSIPFEWDSLAAFPELSGTEFINPDYCHESTIESPTKKILPAQAADFNGDGAVDFVGEYSRPWRCHFPHINEPLGKLIYQTFYYALVMRDGVLLNYGLITGKTYMDQAPAIGDFKVHVIDLNGDGLTDLLYSLSNNRYSYKLNNGAGFNEEIVWQTLPENAFPQFIDLNGDGALDLAWSDRSTQKMYVRLWGSNQIITVRNIDTPSNPMDLHLLRDVNGDGVVDYIKVTTERITGHHGVMAFSGESIPCHPRADANSCPLGYWAPTVPVPSEQQNNAIIQIENGAGGRTHISYGSLANSGHYVTTDVNLAVVNQNVHFNCLWGSSYCPPTYSYTTDSSNFYTRLNGGWDLPSDSVTLIQDNDSKGAPVLEVNGSLQIVTAVESSAPSAGSSSGSVNHQAMSRISYYYGEAKLQASGRGFLGFHKLKTVDEQSGITTTTTYRQDFPFIGQALTTVVHTADTADASVLSYSQNTWDYHTAPGSTRTYQPYLKKAVEITYDLSDDGATQGERLQTRTTETTQDQHGNPTVINITVGEGEDIQVQHVLNTYGSSDEERRLGRLTHTAATIQYQGVTTTRESAFEYYGGNTDWPGLLYKEIIEPGDPVLKVTTTYVYDAVGNKISTEIEARGSSGALEARSSSVAYDSSNRYVEVSYNTLGQEVTRVLARNPLGLPAQVRDINGLETEILYDAMGQEYQRRSLGTGAWTHIARAFCGGAVSCPAGAQYRTQERISGGGLSTQYLDILGRVIRTATVSFDGRESLVDTEYDNLNRVKRQSTPYFSDGTKHWTESTYDKLGRATLITAPDNSQSLTTYNGYTTTTVNALEQSHTEIHNRQGQLIRVSDNLGGTIDYVYDVYGQLLSATTTAAAATGGKQVRVRMCYDQRGRKIAMHDPDKGGFLGNADASCETVAASTTPLNGWWYYRHNGFGELIHQTDTKKQSSSMTYDALGRMLTRTDRLTNNSVESHTRWYYDSDIDSPDQPLHLRGHLTAIVMSENGISEACSGANHCTTYTYNNKSQLTDTVVYHPNSSLGYITSLEYDSIGRVFRQRDALSTLGFANGSGTYTHHNNYGYAEYTQDLLSGDILQKILAINARGQVTEEVRHLGSVGMTTHTYHYDERTGRLEEQQGLKAGFLPLQDNTYVWDEVGNLTSRHSQSANLAGTGRKNLQESFCYDGLNRLIKSHLNTLSGSCNLSSAQQDVEYDGLGNIERKNGVGTYTYGNNAGPHAVTHTSNDGNYTYDHNGNQTGGAERTLAYTSADQLKYASKGGTVTEFRYGPDRSRWQRTDTKSGQTKVTTYLGTVERIEVQDSGIVEWKRYLNGAIYTYRTTHSGGNYTLVTNGLNKSFIFNDHLGSLDVVTNHMGQITHSASFDAWGNRRSAENWGHAFDALSLNITGFTQPLTTRGYTGHEMLDDLGLIHMNGRVYDPRLARFLQADPFIQAASNTQSYNRYSYLWNNPLNATDPSGFFLKKLWNEIRPFVGIIVAIVLCIYAACSGSTGVLTWAGIGAASGAAQAAANGGNIVLGAFTGFFSGAFGAIGGWGGWLAGAALSGATSYMMGGKFGHGFASAGINSLGGGGNGFSGFIQAAVLGGIATEVSGSKFKNGARSAAFAYVVQWGVSKYEVEDSDFDSNPPVSAEKNSRNDTVTPYSSNKAVPEEIIKGLIVKLDLPEGEYTALFASEKEIQAVTKGQRAWGTVDSKNGYVILMDRSLANKMDSTRFVQTLSEEMVHVWQLRSGYVRLLPKSPINRYAIESEATGWVMSKASTLGLKTKSSDYRDYEQVHKKWTELWKKSVY